MVRLGSGQRLWAGCFPQGSPGSFMSRKVEGLSPRMGLRNTTIQAVPGLHWLAAQPQWVTILVGLRAIVVGLSFLNGSGDGTEHLLFLSGG